MSTRYLIRRHAMPDDDPDDILTACEVCGCAHWFSELSECRECGAMCCDRCLPYEGDPCKACERADTIEALGVPPAGKE